VATSKRSRSAPRRYSTKTARLICLPADACQAVGHNHFWFRRYAIEWALRAEDWDAADRHVEALLKRTATEPLPYSSYLVRRGQLLASLGRGAVGESEARELSELRSRASVAGLRLDALAEAIRQ
jgi:hypothetical protein